MDVDKERVQEWGSFIVETIQERITDLNHELSKTGDFVNETWIRGRVAGLELAAFIIEITVPHLEVALGFPPLKLTTLLERSIQERQRIRAEVLKREDETS